jgi:tetratricopeptide (TPR) repeat protein
MPIRSQAGGGPETTLIVVNGDSTISLSIANAYIRMRDIPESHVVWLHDLPSRETITIDDYRERIWNPIRNYLSENDLEDIIDTIAYSADFPYRVNFANDLQLNKLKRNRYRGQIASLTGLTYFARRVEAGNLGYLGINKYFRRDLAPRFSPPRPSTESERRLHEEGMKALKAENYEGAVEILRSAVAGYQWNAAAWYDLARGLAALGREDETLEALSKAVDMGWAHSLQVRSDSHLKRMSGDEKYDALVERMRTMMGTFETARGFRSRYAWTRADEPIRPARGGSLDRYYLSVFLAHTGVRGNSVPEVLSYLRAAVSSDGSIPGGTVYLMENADVRSSARESYFRSTAAALKERGREAEILHGNLPRWKNDVIGAVLGVKHFNWDRSESRLLPGAIVESMTSYGGYFGSKAQTKLTEFLRFGAAGSSGAVAEPYAIQEKFPVSHLHVYYSDGSSLAEAFYQSIEVPYQLVVVGDPLARPFAHFARMRMAEPDANKPWSGRVLLRPNIKPAKGRLIKGVELWVDGRLVDEAEPGNGFLWDTATVEDGSHDVRIVAVDDSVIETRSYLRLDVFVANTGHRIDVNDLDLPVTLGDDVVLSGSAENARQIRVQQGARSLATAKVIDRHWQARVPSSTLGLGETILFVRATFTDGSACRSRPVTVRVQPPPLLPAMKADGDHTSPGFTLLVRNRDGSERELAVMTLERFKKRFGEEIGDAVALRMQGEFRVGKSGFYQLSIQAGGNLHGQIDGQVPFQSRLTDDSGNVHLPVGLEEGWHTLTMELVPEGLVDLKVVLSGDQPGTLLGGEAVRHRE